QTVKTIPSHFSAVRTVSSEDIGRIFGRETDAPLGQFFRIGQLRDTDAPVNLDLRRMLERSIGVFGKTGTGKTFLTRLLLAGIVNWTRQRSSDKVVLLVFDMHNEYGWKALDKESHGTQREVKGLAQLFGTSRVAIFTLDGPREKRKPFRSYIKGDVTIPFSSITASDIALLQEELALTEQGVNTAFLLEGQLGDQWLQKLLSIETDEELKALAADGRYHLQALAALHRKLRILKQFSFLTNDSKKDSVKEIMAGLCNGIHTVIEFGRHSSPLAYLLVANVLTRKIHEAYVQMTEDFLLSGDPSREPYQLVLVVEEAHKFLDPRVASQTIFGTIAREMRKYYVTLLIVDQRPSQIEPEVLSQIGTKFICQLTDERDIQSVLAGIPGGSGLRSVLASLESRRQALIVGHGVPMSVLIAVRPYNSEFYDWLDQCRPLALNSGDGAEAVDISRRLEALWDERYGAQ
ncbi:MAG: ATP-binding protein, partial [Armatimonadetes bacterium]|nr:ATP-binding protein [Armatimonadota bacterium]